MANAPSRKQIVSQLRKYTPRTMDRAAAYNTRTDENSVNAVSWVSFYSVGATRQLDAIANALEVSPSWTADLASSLNYLLFADRLSYFWHGQFRLVFANHPQPLRLMDWEPMTVGMALAFTIGWREQAIYQGYLTAATLNRGYHLAGGYDDRHRRGHAFMLRLFSNWRADGSGHRFPDWAHSVPVYERLIDRWRSTDTEEIGRLLIEACEHHLEQGRPDRKNAFLDFGDDRLSRLPLEILMLLRLREYSGLPNPKLNHPLMEPPFDSLPQTIDLPGADEYMRGTLSRALADWPNFETATSLDSVKTAARQI